MGTATGGSIAAGIDVHHHLLVPSYIAAALREGAADPEWAAAHNILTTQRPDSPAVLLEGRSVAMRDAGMVTALLSVPAAVFRTCLLYTSPSPRD